MNYPSNFACISDGQFLNFHRRFSSFHLLVMCKGTKSSPLRANHLSTYKKAGDCHSP